MRDEIKFVESHEAFGSRDMQAYQVMSLEDPYHPIDVGFFTTYEKALEEAEAYLEACDTIMCGGHGMRIYEVRIQG